MKVKATGVCHSDLSVINGTLPHSAPAVVGHEGAGIVTAVGRDVSHANVGDHVILDWTAPCGRCVDRAVRTLRGLRRPPRAGVRRARKPRAISHPAEWCVEPAGTMMKLSRSTGGPWPVSDALSRSPRRIFFCRARQPRRCRRSGSWAVHHTERRGTARRYVFGSSHVCFNTNRRTVPTRCWRVQRRR